MSAPLPIQHPASSRGRFRRLLLSLAVLALPMAAAAGVSSRMLELPPEAKAPPVSAVVSSQVELAALVSELMPAQSPRVDSPARVDAFANAGTLSQSTAVQLARQLEQQGMHRDALYRYLLLHSSLPSLTLRARVVLDHLSPAEVKLLKDSKSELKRFSENLRRLASSARVEKIMDRHGSTLDGAVQALTQAYPGTYPLTELEGLAGESSSEHPIYLVPSLLSSVPVRVKVPVDHAQAPFRVSVLPVKELTAFQGDAAFYRYTEVARWALDPVFRRFQRELVEVSGVGLPLEEQLLRALFFANEASSKPAEVAAWRSISAQTGYHLVPTLEERLKGWLNDRSSYRTLSLFLPELMEQAALISEGKSKLPRLADPGFEKWSGAVLDHWRVEVVEPSLSGTARPSVISRIRSEGRNGWAVMLSGDKNTNEWQGVTSEPLLVLPGDRVTVAGRLRAKDVRSLGRRVTAAHLEARVLSRDGAVLRRVVSKEMLGTTGWEDVQLEFVVPAGADRMHISGVLAMAGELAFDNIDVNVVRPEVRRFIRNGGFEQLSGNSPASWEPVVASRLTQTGPAVSSRWEQDFDSPAEGRASIKLAGDGLTSHWLELRSIPVAVEPGQRVTLSGMLRARSVTLDARQHRHANFSLTFLSASGVELTSFESPVMEGTSGWKPIEMEVVAPLEAVQMRVGCLLTMSGELWFDDVHLSRR
ncbi:MAG: hypothetical protein ACKO6N_29325 [Myxococcota bacterium]